MKQYIDTLQHILDNGTWTRNRTGVRTISTFGHQIRFDLSEGFPLLTTKRIYWKGVVHELLWFLSGSTNIKYLQDNGVHIWDEWASPSGDLGPVYGKQWRDFGGVDQIAQVIHTIKNNPDSRRIIVSAWNPPEVPDMALPACHCLFQFYVANGKLSCQLYQRSADAFLGVPFNIASYALLVHMIAQVCGLGVGDFVHTFGDLHIYENHLDQVQEQMGRKLRPLAQLTAHPFIHNIDDFKFEDFTLHKYNPHGAIKAEVAV